MTRRWITHASGEVEPTGDVTSASASVVQGVQLAEPARAAYVPARHGEHAAESGALEVPAVQVSQAVIPAPRYVPAEQPLQNIEERSSPNPVS